MSAAADFAATAVALYAGHHVGDYWLQREVDVRRKGEPGRAGRLHCAHHVVTYLATQVVMLIIALPVVGGTWHGVLAGLTISGVTHYIADRRAPLMWLARRIGKTEMITFGAPRDMVTVADTGHGTEHERGRFVPIDNPTLGTGMWALDQAWHIFFGVFVTALAMVIL